MFNVLLIFLPSLCRDMMVDSPHFVFADALGVAKHATVGHHRAIAGAGLTTGVAFAP